MKTVSIAILASILPFTAAVPLEKRVLVYHTVTNVVVQTVDVITTVWVNPTLPSPKVQINNHMKNQHAHLHAHKNKEKIQQSPPAQNPAPAPAPAAAQPQSSPQEVHQPPPVPQPAAPVIPDTPKEAAYVPQPQAPAPAPAPAPQPQPQPQAVAPQPAVAAPQPQPQAVAPQPAAPAPAPVAQTKSKENVGTGSGGTGNCGQVGQPCSGEITFYDTGLGACGTTDDGRNENVFALAHGMMGTQSNGNPFCGRRAEVTLDGKTVVGKLVDKCMGCTGQDIDLSHKMFQALADEGRGRVSGVSWKFID